MIYIRVKISVERKVYGTAAQSIKMENSRTKETRTKSDEESENELWSMYTCPVDVEQLRR